MKHLILTCCSALTAFTFTGCTTVEQPAPETTTTTTEETTIHRPVTGTTTTTTQMTR